jgi:NAD(P)-dependent dehydrogenase (short-subunit alcohol dehydrogenase family)
VRTITEALRQEAGPYLRVTEVSPGMIATEFAESMTDVAVKEAIQQRSAAIAISPDAIARGIAFAIEQPRDVEVGKHRDSPDCSGLSVMSRFNRVACLWSRYLLSEPEQSGFSNGQAIAVDGGWTAD